MKKIICLLIILTVIFNKSINIAFCEEIEFNDLYSIGACLMDAESGRVLYEKNGKDIMANASTTKILTCILALECGNLEDIVKISKYASSMPDVQLNAKEGDEFYLKDLLYSLMLESHNDSAVAIAEHIAGSVEEFSEMMNKKAYDLGCYDTYFITPNGLDATDDKNDRFHSTTAVDLAKIMSYCIKNEQFVEITQTKNYTFANVSGNKSYSVNNKNAFFDMMDGVISGKTGFTNDAGYCYVCALERDGKKYTIALLGCGWPYNKTYKWKDSKILFNYGINEFSKTTISYDGIELPKILVKNGFFEVKTDDFGLELDKDIFLDCYVKGEEFSFLVNDDEAITYEIEFHNVLEAPIEKDDVVGKIIYKANNDVVKEYNMYACDMVKKIDFEYVFDSIVKMFFLK